jgi:hypothetical protein
MCITRKAVIDVASVIKATGTHKHEAGGKEEGGEGRRKG